LSSLANDVRRRWDDTSLSRQFLATAALVLGIAMIVLGSWMSERIQESATRSASEAGAVFLQAFLQPHIQDIASPDLRSADLYKRLDILFANSLFAHSEIRKHLVILKLWRLDGTLAYASHKDIRTLEVVEEEIRIAATGELATAFEDLDEALSGVAPEDNVPLLEVYAPLYRIGTNQIIAVGEFYQSAEWLVDERTRARNWTWVMVALTALLMLGVLYAIVSRGSKTIDRQRHILEGQYEQARDLADQNNQLRKVAEQARVDASEANENFLARLGSDIHDGPLQSLSLLMLSLEYGRDGEGPAETTAEEATDPKLPNTVQLAKSLYAELRNVAGGLVLPGIEKATLEQVVQIAISRHEHATGTAVTSTLRDLPSNAPTAVKICCYRVIQEALNNAFHHAAGQGQRVDVSAVDQQLIVVVADGGPGFDNGDADPLASSQLGLLGIQTRVKALKGSMTVDTAVGKGTTIRVNLPLDPANA
jgi:signal transduction histidine kinase